MLKLTKVDGTKILINRSKIKYIESRKNGSLVWIGDAIIAHSMAVQESIEYIASMKPTHE